MSKNKRSTRDMSTKEAAIIDKWIYALLLSNNNEPIKGRIRFTKEFFLIAIEHVPELLEASQFFAHHFGPYSTRFAERVNQLKKSQQHITAIYKNGDWEYTLTPLGLEVANRQTEGIGIELQKTISNIKSRNKKLSLKELLKEIYLHYSKYAERAPFHEDVILEKVKLSDLQIINDGPDAVVYVPPDEEISLKGKAAENLLKILSE
ncbi:MAG: hypothetical protein KAU62_09995 [Candidatus Heimdallarchaeota archaeon]|nr:hypothetical protein [Candidatus Heimdallarchaeota archaeon]MCK4611474.1 hypothetical protein [Candidatus Heimdallarchaeota archaeon]